MQRHHRLPKSAPSSSHSAYDAEEALRLLLRHHLQAERQCPDGAGVFWVTYLVGCGADLDRTSGAQFGFLAVEAAGAEAAQLAAEEILARRSEYLGMPYTVTAVHSPAQLVHGLFALHAIRARTLPTPKLDEDLESWEAALSERMEEVLSG